MLQTQLPPFSWKYTENVPQILNELGCSIVISTYQAGKLVLISPVGNKLVQLPRTFAKPMGIHLSDDNSKMVLACKDEVITFKNSAALAKHYPKSPNKYDALFLPRSTYHTGAIDVHDISFGSDGIYAVNTMFSCITKINEDYNFEPVWKPSFVSEIASEDRCHLNGMVMVNGKPKYVSAFSTDDTHQGWRNDILNTGVIIDTTNDEIIASGLSMPHSPRLINNDLYVLMSGTGDLVKIDTGTGTKSTILNLEGFVRGMSHFKDYLFIGVSKLRSGSSTFEKLDLSKFRNRSEIAIVHLPTAKVVGQIEYLNSVEEVYDVQVLPGLSRPNILNTLTEDHKAALSIPTATFWAKPKS